MSVVTKGWWYVGSKCDQICESVMLHLVSQIVCGNHATFPVCRPSNQPIGGLGMPEEGHQPIRAQHQPRPSISSITALPGNLCRMLHWIVAIVEDFT